jgi:hypothetical protein
MKIILFVCLMALALPALAAGNSNNSRDNTATANGGAGGAGGAGVRVGIAGARATAGASAGVIGSGNSANQNTNRNSNHATGGTATGGTASQTLDGGANNSSVTVSGDTYASPRFPASTAYAPTIAPTAVCMGSSSIGGQGLTFGVSFGSSWTDSNCMLLEQVRIVATVIGDETTAAEMMCDVPAYRAARQRVGNPCTAVRADSEPVAVDRHH